MSDMQRTKSILADLEINVDNMFSAPELFHEECMAHAERLRSVMQGNELPGDKLCRDMIKAAAAKTNPLTERVKKYKDDLRALWNVQENELTNEELAQMHSVLTYEASIVHQELNERLINNGLTIIRSKRLASYLYQKLRVFHDKWREAQGMFNPDKKWAVINGMPGNYKDNSGTFFAYIWKGEEYSFHSSILRMLKKDEQFADSLSEVKTVADFHEWIDAHPECEVRVMSV